MANLFTKTPQNKHVELSIGTAFLKPLPMKLLPFAQKLGNQDTPTTEQTIAFSMILKEVLVDNAGNRFEDVETMTPEEISDSFSLEDFTTILQAIMPEPDEGNVN